MEEKEKVQLVQRLLISHEALIVLRDAIEGALSDLTKNRDPKQLLRQIEILEQPQQDLLKIAKWMALRLIFLQKNRYISMLQRENRRLYRLLYKRNQNRFRKKAISDQSKPS